MKFPPPAVIGGSSRRQGMIPCTLSCGYYLTRKENRFPLLLRRNVQLAVVVLLARPPLAANPDAKHPGKARENPRRKARFPLGFSRLSWARSHHTFVNPSAAGGACSIYPYKPLRQVRVQGDHLPGGARGNAPPVLLRQIPVSHLRTKPGKGGKSRWNAAKPWACLFPPC